MSPKGNRQRIAAGNKCTALEAQKLMAYSNG
jgi:hypothetical protein